VPYPFPKDIYVLPEAYQVDTGFIHSNLLLGINSAEGEHIQLKKVDVRADTYAVVFQ
jgi:hypothetical protein